jgi:hypothetical protein
MTRHEFLKALHELLHPEVYLEIGVQYGTSLALAEKSTTAIGIDPQPLVNFTLNHRPNQTILPMTSDAFFQQSNFDIRNAHLPAMVNLGFIDGMHLFEYALRDFVNLERFMARGGVIAFDDVLPYSQSIAEREQPPGDWTGDVWKVFPILTQLRPDLKIWLVNTTPTGMMVVTGLEHEWEPDVDYDHAIDRWLKSDEVPPYILNRTEAFDPNVVLGELREHLDQEQ